MKGIVKKVEQNIYLLQNGKHYVEMNYLNQVTNKKSKKRQVTHSLAEARAFCREFRAKTALKLHSQPNREVTLGYMIDICLDLKQNHKSFESIQRHLDEIGTYFDREKPIHSITEPKIRAFTKFLQTRKKKGRHKGTLSNQSVDHVLKELRYLVRLAKKRRYIA